MAKPRISVTRATALAAAVVIAIGLVFSTTTLAAGSRGVTVKLKASEAANAADAGEVRLYESSHALVIGIDAYRDRAWPRLSKGVSDARAVAAALEERGFEVTLHINLTGDALEKAFEDFFIEKGSNRDARLFAWYGGHGHTIDEEGYLIPADGADPRRDEVDFLRKALSLRRFGEFVRQAKSKHVLAVFDSCFAGTIFQVARSRTPPAITRVTTEPVRQFLSSGDAGQQVSDDGAFASLFVDALKNQSRADANGDGYLTGSELGSYLTYEVSNVTNNVQTPRHGKLRASRYNKGDFVFVLPGSTVAYGSGDEPRTSARGADETVWTSIQNSDRPLDFRTFISTYPDSPFAPFARARLQAVGRTQTASLPPAHDIAKRAEAVITTHKLLLTQRNLNELGYDPGPLDGVMGSKTRAAIEDFQQSNGLPVDGVVTDGLLASLKAAQAKVASVRPVPVPARPAPPTQSLQVGTTFRDCDGALVASTGPDLPPGASFCGPQMVVVPAGSFDMGDLSGDGENDEKPVHRVTIPRSFAVGAYEVTQAEWRSVMGNNPSFFKGDRDPVNSVTWNEAKEFVRRLSVKTGKTYRLMSEAEWEYAARAGSRTKYPWGNNIDKSKAKYGGGASARTVGSYNANSFGLYDTAGNVWEWTEDCWNNHYGSAPTDGSVWRNGDCSKRVRRGGSLVDGPWHLRSAFRNTLTSSRLFKNTGFRIARTLDPQEATLSTAPKVASNQIASVRPAPVPQPSSRERPAFGVFPQTYKSGDTFKDCAACPQMVVVPAGAFDMGDLNGGGHPYEKPVHRVTIPRPFAVGVYEVTQAEWRSVMGDNPSRFKGDRNPVEQVSWDDAKDFLKRLNAKTGKEYRLLTEAEWEYAARAGSRTIYPWGNGIDPWKAKYGSKNGAHPVGSYSANVFGLFDTAGNVLEWTEDCWNTSYSGAPSNGQAQITGNCRFRVFRGGFWGDKPGNVRSAFRFRGTSGFLSYGLGFRVARSLPRT